MEEDVDEDMLFSDLNYLKNADIGRLMRYLTKKRQLKVALKLDSTVISASNLDLVDNKDEILLVSSSENTNFENTNDINETLTIDKEESSTNQRVEIYT